jgi:hypothetical protein
MLKSRLGILCAPVNMTKCELTLSSTSSHPIIAAHPMKAQEAAELGEHIGATALAP